MPNYYIEQKNKLIDNSRAILDYLTGMYMDRHHGAMLTLSGDSYALSTLIFKQLLSYRKGENDDAMRKRTTSAIRNWLNLLYTENCGLGYFLSSNGTSVTLTLAVEDKCSADAAQIIGASIPELKAKDAPGADAAWRRNSSWGGLLVNIPPLTSEYVDRILEGLIGLPGNIGILAFPSTRSEAFLSGLFNLKGQTESLSGITTTFGSGSRQSIKSSFPMLTKLEGYLDKQIDRWATVRGMWEGCIWFSASTEEDADRLGAMLAGSLVSEANTADAPCIYVLTDQNPFQSRYYVVPNSDYGGIEYALPQGLIKSPLDTYFTFNDMAALLQLPSYSHPGFDVLTIGTASNPLRPFSIGGNITGELVLGKVSDTGTPFQIRKNDLTEHALVTGATGSGKTNTVMRIVEEVRRCGVPYCIIEPAKKEYWLLSSRDSSLSVYSAGQDALPLLLNPFVPEYGIDIATHISALMYAFSGAFDMEAPTQFALEGLLKHTYKKVGWDLNDIFYGQDNRFPQIDDLIHILPEYMEREHQYGSEVRDNIRGAILNRLMSMSEGVISRIVSCTPSESLTGEHLCSKNIVLELDDLPIDLKPFVTELVLMKVSQHLRRQSETHDLRNIIVVEEAHNVFSEVSHQQPQSSRSIASEYFSNMLSEIRAYGTGLIIADQGASKINSNAIANTKVKILHSVASKPDADAEAYAMHLDERRMAYLPEFRSGEALVAVRGEPQVWKINVSEVPRQHPRNMACLFCKHRPMCLFDDLDRILPAADSSLAVTVTSAIQRSYDIKNWKSTISWVQGKYGLRGHDELCILGYLLERFAPSCGEREKRRILYLYENAK